MELMIIFIVAILLVIILSGLISGTEAALLSISHPEVKEMITLSSGSKEKKAKRLLKIKENLQRYITTIVILNNIVNIIGSMFIALLATRLFDSFYVGVVSGLLTFSIILFSEIIPKLYGESYNKEISLIITTPLIFISNILRPIIWMLDFLINIFIDTSKISKQVSEGVIREMAIMGKEEGSINMYESKLIENVFELDDTPVSDIMIPKSKALTIDTDTTFDEIAKLTSKTGHTRFPVENDNSEIIGLVNVKDLFNFIGKKTQFTLSKIIRPIIYVPNSMMLSTLEEKLKKNRIHMAAVVNEHGEFIGLVTLEDVIEEILGEIEDEYDNNETFITKIREGNYNIRASIEIGELNRELNLGIPISEKYSTLNGYLTTKFGDIPKTNKRLQIKRGSLRILKRTRKKILLVEFREK
jgi:CBS domain containing-hemolysin-like protein